MLPVNAMLTLPDAPAARLSVEGVTLTEALESGSRCTTARWITAAVAPVLVMTTPRVGRVSVTTPKETVAGTAVNVEVSAAPAFSFPTPTATDRAVTATGHRRVSALAQDSQPESRGPTGGLCRDKPGTAVLQG